MLKHQNCNCCLSRRQCLKLLSMSALGAGVMSPVLEAVAKTKSKASNPDFVDPATLRPNPEVRMAGVILELPRPYWLGWPGTTYDLDKHQQEYRARLDQSARKLGIQMDLASAPINKDEDLTAWISRIKSNPPHALLVILQEIHRWPMAERIARETGIPTLIFAPVGTTFTGQIAKASRIPGVHVISSMDWSAVEDAMRLVRAKRRFEETRVLWIRKNEHNETVLDRLGIKVRAVPRDTFNLAFDKQPASEEVRDFASDLRRRAKKIVEPNVTDTFNCARAYVTAKRLMADFKANALSMDCLGMVSSKLVPTPPCGAWAVLQDQGITAGCEADLYGAVSLMMTSYLLDRPGYMNDPVPETAHNSLIVAHCTSGTRLNGFDKPAAPYILRNHSESALGVSVQVLWPERQPATLVRFTGTDEMIIDTGKVLRNIETSGPHIGPRAIGQVAGGCRTSVELQMDNIEDCRDVKGFHQVVTLGNHRRLLENFCELYGIKHVHSPEHSTFAMGGAA
jgi:hypothetical protein